MSDCTVYIDEAGDLGINRGTKWFVLSAVIVDRCEEHNIRHRITQIKQQLHIQEIHMRKIRDFYKRAFIVRELNNETFTYMNLLVDTTQIDVTRLPTYDIAYNYFCRYLLERVSCFLEDTGRTGDVVLSARGTSRDSSLITYIQEKLLPYPYNNINAAVFEKISAKTAGTIDLLQLADVCATTLFWAYEVNGLGFCTPCFVKVLKSHIYRQNNTLKDYGIKTFSTSMEADIEYLRKKRMCAKKERTPGATAT